jgi:hypothetical protein
MDERYNVYFAGEVIKGHGLDSVREKLAKIFNADQQTLDKLFCGRAQLIKRNCDEATARKYQAAMERAGAQAIIKAAEASAGTDSGRPMTRAEKIAALAATPVEERYLPADAGEATTTPPTEAEPEPEAEPGDLSLEPPGTAVLREDERAEPVVCEVDTSRLAVDTAAGRLSPEPPPSPSSPDTSHLHMAEVGETIPNLPASEAPLSPNTDALALSPSGTDFSDCKPPQPEAPQQDLSALELAPAGTDVLEDRYRDRKKVPAPSTDHISLEN